MPNAGTRPNACNAMQWNKMHTKVYQMKTSLSLRLCRRRYSFVEHKITWNNNFDDSSVLSVRLLLASCRSTVEETGEFYSIPVSHNDSNYGKAKKL